VQAAFHRADRPGVGSATGGRGAAKAASLRSGALCIRIYSGGKGLRRSRPRFTDPEILGDEPSGGDPAQMAALQARRHRRLPLPRPARENAALSRHACCSCKGTRRLRSRRGREFTNWAVAFRRRCPRSGGSGDLIRQRTAEGWRCAKVLVLGRACRLPDREGGAGPPIARSRPQKHRPARRTNSSDFSSYLKPVGATWREQQKRALRQRVRELWPWKSSWHPGASAKWQDLHRAAYASIEGGR